MVPRLLSRQDSSLVAVEGNCRVSSVVCGVCGVCVCVTVQVQKRSKNVGDNDTSCLYIFTHTCRRTSWRTRVAPTEQRPFLGNACCMVGHVRVSDIP